MTITTKNKVVVRGFVGRYIHIPKKRGDPARFDVATIERIRSESGELLTIRNWHTVRTFDVAKVDDDIRTGDVVEIHGRMDTSLVNGNKHVEITADEIEVLLTQEQRDMLRGIIEEDFDEEAVP